MTAPYPAPLDRRPRPAARWLPFVLILAAAATAFALGLHRHLSLEALRDGRGLLVGAVAAHALAAPLVYMAFYVVVTVCALPGATIMTLTGGFLFGALLGGTYSVIGATIGAVLLFLAARSAFADLLRARAGGTLAKLEAGFRRDAFNYLLVLRLVPLFPFFVVNLAAAFLGTPIGTFVVATFVGIIPATFIYASVGSGLGTVFDAGGTPDLRLILSWPVLGPLAGLAVMSLIPVVYKRLRREA
jgi:uncharacterized membrane protein YdjX (TVP38/TMEM64 family)